MHGGECGPSIGCWFTKWARLAWIWKIVMTVTIERLRVMKRALAHIVEHTLDDPNCWGNLKYFLI